MQPWKQSHVTRDCGEGKTSGCVCVGGGGGGGGGDDRENKFTWFSLVHHFSQVFSVLTKLTSNFISLKCMLSCSLTLQSLILCYFYPFYKILLRVFSTVKSTT